MNSSIEEGHDALRATGEWGKAYVELAERIARDPSFPALVRSYGNPASSVPSRRARRLAERICVRLELEPAIYLGNVYGAAADYIHARRLPESTVIK